MTKEQADKIAQKLLNYWKDTHALIVPQDIEHDMIFDVSAALVDESRAKEIKTFTLPDPKLSKRKSFTIKDNTGTWVIESDPQWDVRKEGDTYFCTLKEPDVDASKVTECAEFDEYYEKKYPHPKIELCARDVEFLTRQKEFAREMFSAGQKSKALVLPSELQKELDELKEYESESTQVVRWYAHPDEVRGPFCRWLTVTDVDPRYEKHVGTKRADAKFAAESMNFVIALIKRINEGLK